MPKLLTTLALAAALTTAGCTAVGGADDAGAAAMEAQTGSFGVVRIERETAMDADVSLAGAELSGSFAQYRGVDGRAVLALLGGRAAAPESCRLAGAEAGAFGNADAQVELLDVGDVEVRVAGTRTRMMSRTFPDLAGMVAGVFYAQDATLGAARADVDEYVITAEGRELPGFEVVAVAPTGFSELTVDGLSPDDVGYLDRGVDVELQWDAGDPRDQVEVDLVAGGAVLECVVRDDGSFRIGSDALSLVDADEDARLVVRRVRTQPFDAPGIDAAWVDVASTQTLRLAVR